MALLCNLEVADLNYGDFLMLLCSFFASFHIIFIGKVASKIESGIEFNLIQNLFMALWALPILIFKKWPADFSPLLDIKSNAFHGILFLSVFSSILAFSIQVVSQKKIPSHVAGLIFLLESPFAAIFAYFILDERLNTMNIMGAVLIVLSVALVPFLGREVTASIK
jgi:drug/metabolite transporter (DMT)-like permease